MTKGKSGISPGLPFLHKKPAARKLPEQTRIAASSELCGKPLQ